MVRKREEQKGEIKGVSKTYIALVVADLLVNVVVAKNLVDPAQDTWHVAVDIDNLGSALLARTGPSTSTSTSTSSG